MSGTVHHDHTKLTSPGHPVNSFLFLNPANIKGARLYGTLTGFVFSDSRTVIHVSVSRFVRGRSISHLINTPPKCINCRRNNCLARTIHHHPCSIVLLSRIRGTRPSIFGVLLRMLSSKHLASKRKEAISFHGAIIVVASGLNSSLVRRHFNRLSCTRVGRLILNIMDRGFHPRFVGHVSRIIIFRPLNRRRVTSVTRVRLGHLCGHLRRHNCRVRVSSRTLGLLDRGNCSPICNTHPLGHTVRRRVRGPLTRRVLSNRLIPNGIVHLRIGRSQVITIRWVVGQTLQNSFLSVD